MEPGPKRQRVATKTQDEILVENNARNKLRRLPLVEEPGTREEFIKWIKTHYTKKPLADDARQRLHWDGQTCWPSKRTFLHDDNTATSSYNKLQSGHTRSKLMTDEETQIAKTNSSQKHSATLISLNLGQLHWIESAAVNSFIDFMISFGYSVRLERMLDCVTVDFMATSGSFLAPVQVKVSRALPGTTVNFNVNEIDGGVGGRYEDHILICLIVSVTEEDNLKCKDFDELPDVDIREVYIMKSSHLKSRFRPVAYDHSLRSKRGRENIYEKFRYVLGRDDPEDLDILIQSLESSIKDIHVKRKWTRDACFFNFGKGSPNTNVADSQEMELRGMKAVCKALSPFKARAPLRQNETVDVVFHDLSEFGPEASVRVSLKTATYNGLKKETKKFSGFIFCLKKAPNSHHCDIVIAVRFDLATRTQVVAASVFNAKNVYNTGRKTYGWNKFAHEEETFDFTHENGRQAFKEHVASFMQTDAERIKNP